MPGMEGFDIPSRSSLTELRRYAQMSPSTVSRLTLVTDVLGRPKRWQSLTIVDSKVGRTICLNCYTYLNTALFFQHIQINIPSSVDEKEAFYHQQSDILGICQRELPHFEIGDMGISGTPFSAKKSGNLYNSPSRIPASGQSTS